MILLSSPPLSRFLLLGLSLASVFPAWSFGSASSVAQPAPASPQMITLAPPMDALQAVQQLTLELVNRDRVTEGLPPMQVDPLLAKAAQNHAIDMLKRNYFDHYSPEGIAPKDRLAEVGGNGYPSENIVMRYSSHFKNINIQILEEFQDQWMNSPDHRRNLMNPRNEKFGYGLAIDPTSGKTFAVQMFGRR